MTNKLSSLILDVHQAASEWLDSVNVETHLAATLPIARVMESFNILNKDLPALLANPLLRSYHGKLKAMQKMLAFNLQIDDSDLEVTTPGTSKKMFSGETGDTLDRICNSISALHSMLEQGNKVTGEKVEELHSAVTRVYIAALKYAQEVMPPPAQLRKKAAAKEALTQESFIMDKTKILGKPGSDADSVNFFDNRELSRKFYSQFFEDAVMICDDGTYYQVLEVLMMSGNFVCMLQDILHPQIVFTISVNDLMAHIWKWISPFDVVVNPQLAPKTVSSVADIVSVGDLEAPEVPEQWLSY